MKLIFEKEKGGNDALKRAIGFIDKSTSLTNLNRFIKAATRELIQIIGKPTYDIIQAYTDLEEPTYEQTELIEAVQDCVGIEAIRRYAPSKDVAHTQNGRRMRMDDHEKQAFEWMIDRDNDNMERLYYQSLDQLLIILEELASWKETDQYKKLNSLFVNTTAAFQEYFDINNSRLLLLKLQPGLRQAESYGIRPRIGEETMAALKEDPTSNIEVFELVKEACVFWALAWAMKRLNVMLFPDGVLQRFVDGRATTQGKQAAALNEPAWAAQEFQKDADNILQRIEELVAPEVEITEEEDTDEGFGFGEGDNFVST